MVSPCPVPLCALGQRARSTLFDGSHIPERWEGLSPMSGRKASLAETLHSKWLFTFPSGVGAQTIHQWPPVKMQLVGSQLSLECVVKGTSNPYLYWYRQAEGGSLQLLFYSLSLDGTNSEAPRNFTASRPEDGRFILSSQSLLLSDSGFYLCAWSLTLRQAGSTSVQKPHPLREPSLWGRVDDIWLSDCQPM